MTLEKTIKRAEKLLQKLKSVRELYGERKIETAMKESVSAVKLAEELTLLVRSLPAHTSHPQARELVQSAIRSTVPVDIGFTEQGWLCLRMPILLPRKEKSSLSYIRDFLYPVLERLDMMEELRNTQKMDNGLFAIYTNIFFIPMDDFGVRILRIITLPDWYERLQQGLFKREVRPFGKGSFTYDAYQNGVFCLSFLDGDLWRLFRFREAILSREGNFCVYCFHEQVDFLRQYLGDRIRFATVSIESVERVFRIEEKCLL